MRILQTGFPDLVVTVWDVIRCQGPGCGVVMARRDNPTTGRPWRGKRRIYCSEACHQRACVASKRVRRQAARAGAPA